MLTLPRWLRIVLAAIGVLIVVVAFLMIAGHLRWSRRYVAPTTVSLVTLEVLADTASVERGRHLAMTLNCRYCHGGDLSGGPLLDVPALAVVYAPNLTSGVGGMGENREPDDWLRALRHGIGRDGRGLVGMPSRIYSRLDAEDLAALIAYLTTLPAIDNALPRRRTGPLGRVLIALGQFPAAESSHIDHDAGFATAPEPAATPEYGAYLALVCTSCHGVELNGGTIRDLQGELLTAPNLTPGGRLGAWNAQNFADALRSGILPDGGTLSESMPWRYVGQLNDIEIEALWRFLTSLPALEQGGERTDL